MQTGLQAEALLCPNCKEEVPKTLYCLNCGYPLYKVEAEPAAEEDAPEPEAPVEAEPVEEAEPVIEAEPVNEPEPVIEAEPVEEVVEVESPPEPIEVEEETVEITPEPPTHIDPEPVQEEVVEIAPEPIIYMEPEPVAEEAIEPAPEPVAVPEEDVFVLIDTVEEIEAPAETAVEPVVEEITDYEPAVEPVAEEEAPAETAIVAIEETETVEVEEIIEPVVEAEPVPVPEHDPDPGIKAIMMNLAKNISMKIKLVDLQRTGGVKPEIFSKLFDSYQTRGELLMNSRSENLERVRYDLGSMEKALHEAKEGLEELEIRRTIEDISEAEYAAKAPGFQWDIEQYKDEVGTKQAEIYYLEDITRVMTPIEIEELVNLGEGCFDALDELVESGVIDGATAARIRVSLEEALACIR